MLLALYWRISAYTKKIGNMVGYPTYRLLYWTFLAFFAVFFAIFDILGCLAIRCALQIKSLRLSDVVQQPVRVFKVAQTACSD